MIETKIALLQVEIWSLEARVEALSCFTMNNTLQIDCSVTRKQIETLEKKLAKLKTMLKAP